MLLQPKTLELHVHDHSESFMHKDATFYLTAQNDETKMW